MAEVHSAGMHNTSMTPMGRTLWAAWCALLALTLLWDWSGLDVTVMQQIGGPDGFALRHHGLLELWLHDRARTLGTLVFVALWVWALWPAWRASGRPRWHTHRLWIATLVTLNLLAVNLIKNNSLTSCPWDMRLWGGGAEVVSHWRWGVSDGGPGRCFPGGHASAALAFAPWVLALWWPSPGAGTLSPRTAHRALGLGAVAAGGLCHRWHPNPARRPLPQPHRLDRHRVLWHHPAVVEPVAQAPAAAPGQRIHQRSLTPVNMALSKRVRSR